MKTPGRAPAALSPTWVFGFYTPMICLLYTSDAADERSSVDLGGRRIIKKKKKKKEVADRSNKNNKINWEK